MNRAGQSTSFTYEANSDRLSKVEAIRNGEAVGYECLHNALGQRVFTADATIQEPQNATRVTKGFLNRLQGTLGWLFKSVSLISRQAGLAFVYDEQGNMLASYSNGSTTAAAEQMEFIWLPLEDGRAIPIGAYKDGQFYAVHADHLGTPRLITGAAKAVAWQWPYSAYGANKPSGVLKAVMSKKTKEAPAAMAQLKMTTPLLAYKEGFPGQYCEFETALCYNWWRYFSSKDGRYRQFDPIRPIVGLNNFNYVDADPLRFTDPSGLVKHVSGPWIDCGKGCRIRIDYTLDEKTGRNPYRHRIDVGLIDSAVEGGSRSCKLLDLMGV